MRNPVYGGMSNPPARSFGVTETDPVRLCGDRLNPGAIGDSHSPVVLHRSVRLRSWLNSMSRGLTEWD
jgi:hypothetical protein